MVIAIIALLMGLLIPAVSSMREKAKVAKAKTEINAIKIAIKSFETTYGVLPLKDSSNNDMINTTTGLVTEYDKLMEWLTQSDCGYGASGVDTSGNPRKVKFLDPLPNGGSYKDPWGNPYVIYLDTDYNDKVTIDGDALNGNIFIYSYGKNKNNDNGRCYGINSQNKRLDDIGSWHN